MPIQIHPSRYQVLWEEFSKPYFAKIKQSLIDKKTAGEVLYPTSQKIFAAYDLTPFDEVQVVILGQDPYHGPGQAHGLSFSVPDEITKLPPSLKNIFKEVESDIWTPIPTSGNLSRRAQQWILLLNSVLTVTARYPASHSGVWREQFTDATIQVLSDQREWLVFLLRGKFAQSKTELIDQSKHLVLQTTHPSPFSAYKWFNGCKHFSQTNSYLESKWKSSIQR